MLSLDQSAITELEALPETGMGFQIVEATFQESTKTFLVFNCEQAVDLSTLDLAEGSDSATVLENGMRIVEAVKGSLGTTLGYPGAHSFKLVASRVGALSVATGTSAGSTIGTVHSSSLVKSLTLPANRVFHRYSAFKRDRRVNATTGDFLPGTYATPESEVPFVPTGFVAVGRFALPSALPASYHYEIEAPMWTPVEFGTVAPAFGQAGGGVEAFFANSVKNASKPPRTHKPLEDE